MCSSRDVILHVLVVGFHHKKGCQVEYCYPSLRDDGSTAVHEGDLPCEWSTLPSLAMPDGAHNVQKDTVYFLLPSLSGNNRSIYAVSCYRQISAQDLLCKSADVTRCTVQKSVCVLSTVPLFGVINAKLELITQAYFNERDFSRVEVLAEMYANLKLTVSQAQLSTQAFVGLSAREFVSTFGHRALVLFKLILLERRVLFHLFPVQKLSETILVLISLFPGMLERGLVEACNYSKSPAGGESGEIEEIVEIPGKEEETLREIEVEAKEETVVEAEKPLYEEEDTLLNEIDMALNGAFPKQSSSDGTVEASPSGSKLGLLSGKLKTKLTTGWTVVTGGVVSPSASRSVVGRCYSTLDTDTFGFPLSIFSKGSVCQPYVSLSYLDALVSDKIRSCVFGATNALFKQRHHLLDVIVQCGEDGEMNIEILDAELRRQVALTTADLRFTEYLLAQVCPDEHNNGFYDHTNWEGGDEWVRHQFNAYLLSLYATCRTTDQQSKDDFGEAFVQAWKTTHNYRVWTCGHYPDLAGAVPGHPFAGQLGLSDVRRHISHTVGSSEQARKMQHAVQQTGKYIGQTGKQVRSVFGSFLTDLAGSVYPPNNNNQATDKHKDKTEQATAEAGEEAGESLDEKQTK